MTTVSMVRYTAVRHSGVPVVVRAFPACVNIGRNFFSPASLSQHGTSQQLPPDKLEAANRETLSKSNLDERPFVQVWTISISKAPFAFCKFNNISVTFDHGLFCSKMNNKKVHFCLTYTSGFETFLLKYHCSKPYLLMYLAFKCEYIMNL